MTDSASFAEVSQLLAIQFAVFQALLLIAAGGHKLVRLERTSGVIREFAGVPRVLAAPAAIAIALFELCAGVSLCLPAWRAAGAAAAAAIWGVYLLLILRAIAGGRGAVDCGCSFGAAHAPLGVFQAARNALLTAGAVFAAAVCARGAPAPVMASQILAAFALLALYFALDQAMALQAPRAGALL